MQSHKTIKVLDRGYVKFLDHLGNDKAIVNAARISFDKQEHIADEVSAQDRKLIFYLLKHGHTSPFEQVVFTFLVKAPIFVARQWFRHRTHRINEVSGRYTEFEPEFYIPDDKHINSQNISNKQGRGQILSADASSDVREKIESINDQTYEIYKACITEHNLARELARTVLGVGIYTKFQVQIDLNNLFKFFMLRSDAHAQFEIQEYSRAMETIVQEICPIAFEAFREYMQSSRTFSRSQCTYMQTVLKHIRNGKTYTAAVDLTDDDETTAMSERDRKEIKQFLQSPAP